MAKGPYYSSSVQSREFFLSDSIFKGMIPLVSPLYITELKASSFTVLQRGPNLTI